MNQNISRVGIDLAKNIFQVCAVDVRGNVLFNKTVKRADLKAFVANIPACEVILESCASSNYWYRVFSEYGHTVKLINPAYVRPFVKTNKSDSADAQALCEAAARPTMRFVQPKTLAQQDVQLTHRVRTRLVSRRTSLSNQLRGLLAEYDIIISEGINNVRKAVPMVLEDGDNDLSVSARSIFAQLYDELVEIDTRVNALSKELARISDSHSRCKQFKTVYGIGPMVATSLYAVMGDPKHYKNGREFAAFLGLVPRQYSTGGKPKLGSISKRGDVQTRTLLVQGAQAALSRMHKRDDRLSQWACRIKERRGHNVAAVALANKLTRICWAMANSNTDFRLKTV